MSAPMTDERLDQIRHDLGSGFVYVAGVSKAAHVSVACELLTEVDRLRDVNVLLRVDVANATPDHDAVADDAIAAHEEVERLQARLDGFEPLRTEWSTDNTFGPAEDFITNEKLALGRVAHRPDIHRQVVTRQIYAGPWLAAGGVVSSDALPVLDESGCTLPMPSRAEVEQQTRTDWDAEAGRNAAEGPFWARLNRRLKDPEFLDSYIETSLKIQAYDVAKNAQADHDRPEPPA